MRNSESSTEASKRQFRQQRLSWALVCLLASIPLGAGAETYWYDAAAPAPLIHYMSGTGACHGGAQRILSSYQAGTTVKHRIQALSASDIDGTEYLCSVTIYKKQLSLWLPVIVGQTFSVFQAGTACPVTGRGDANGYCGAKQPRNECNGSNPILGAFGAKYQYEQDLAAGQLVPITLGRHYNHLATEINTMGAGWRHEYERKVVVDDVNLGSSQFDPTVLTLQRQDGIRYRFTANGTAWQADADVKFKVTRLTDVDIGTTGWRVYTPDGLIEVYNAAGDLTNITMMTGAALALGYDTSHRLKTLTDPFGKAYTVGWDASSRINKVTAPDSTAYDYGYDGQGNLASVTYPNGTATGDIRSYVYNEAVNTNNNSYPNFLTGIVDPGSKRFATFKYDGGKRAVLSTHAGGAQQTSFVYVSDANVQITGPLGTASTYTYATVNGVRLVSGRTQAAGAGCNASSSAVAFDANGNKASEDDFNGHRTCYSYSTASSTSVGNLEVVRVEGLTGSTGANAGATATACSAVIGDGVDLAKLFPGRTDFRKISTQWHPQWALKTKQAEPKLLTTWVYNGQPDPFNSNQVASCVSNTYTTSTTQPKLPDGSAIAVLCKKVEQATTDADGSLGFNAVLDNTDDWRAWQRVESYTYTEYGQVLTHTDAAGVKTTSTYYTDGPIFSGTAPNEVGHYSGDLKDVSNAAGHKTTYDSYDRAGRLLQSTDPNALVTKYSYTPRGWLKTQTVGTLSTSYDYWPTGLLKKVSQPDGSALYYQWDDAHRLTDVSDQVSASGAPAGNWVHYTLDNAGNRKSEDIKDASGALVRNIARNYDALNRLQNVSGAQQ